MLLCNYINESSPEFLTLDYKSLSELSLIISFNQLVFISNNHWDKINYQNEINRCCKCLISK